MKLFNLMYKKSHVLRFFTENTVPNFKKNGLKIVFLSFIRYLEASNNIVLYLTKKVKITVEKSYINSLVFLNTTRIIKEQQVKSGY